MLLPAIQGDQNTNIFLNVLILLREQMTERDCNPGFVNPSPMGFLLHFTVTDL